MIKKAIQLEINQKAVIMQFSNERIEGKLVSMGIMPGSCIELIRKAPFGGGFFTKIDGLSIALRSNEVANIIIR